MNNFSLHGRQMGFSALLLGFGLALSPVAARAADATAPAAKPPLVAQAPIAVAGGKGRFDLLEVDAKRYRLLVPHGGNAALSVFDSESGKLIKEIPTGGANGVAIDDVDGKYFVGAGDGNQVAVVDAQTLTVTNTIPTTGPPDAMAFDPKTGTVYAGHDDGTEVWVIDAKTEKIVKSIAIPEGPEYVQYDPKTDLVYQNIKTADRVDVIDPKTQSVVAHLATAPMQSPHGLAVDFESGHLFDAGANGKLVEIDLASGKVIASADIAQRVDQIAFDAGTKRIYCASGGGMLSVVQETATGLQSLGDVPTARGCHSVTVDPNTHAVWVAYGGADGGYIMKLVAPTQ